MIEHKDLKVGKTYFMVDDYFQEIRRVKIVSKKEAPGKLYFKYSEIRAIYDKLTFPVCGNFYFTGYFEAHEFFVKKISAEADEKISEINEALGKRIKQSNDACQQYYEEACREL